MCSAPQRCSTPGTLDIALRYFHHRVLRQSRMIFRGGVIITPVYSALPLAGASLPRVVQTIALCPIA